nr:reverse transcriptase domain-containing protein [Tanacetum cinerariifolium]
MANTTPLVTTVTKPAINPVEANSTPRINIQEFCEEHYEDILPIIMEKVCHDRRKDVHTRLDFGEGPRERIREDSYYSNMTARATEPGRVKVQDRLKYETDSRDSPRGRSRTRTLSASRDDRHKDRECFRSTKESYGDSFSHSYRDGSRHHHMKRKRDNSAPFSASRRAARVWFDELPPERIDGYKDLRAAFLAYFMQQKKYVKDPVETIEDFMKRFKIETGRMKGAPECMRISGFMHGVNNPELTKRLNEHVPKTIEEMMITTTAFIRGEAAAASKKKGHVSWKPQDQSKRHSLDKRTPKEILATEASKFQPPPPMVTPVEKRSSNKFCDFHNDKGHSTDESMQLKKQIEELVRAGKLSYLIKEIKQGRDQSKAGKKETALKDKPTAIYMVQSWKRTVKQKSQMVPATTSLTGFSGETIWPLGQLRLLVTIGDATHSTKAWMNFMTVKSMSPYNDDLLVKSYTEAEMMRDIEETFRTLRKVNMKLNPKKCSFGLAERVFLGYVITPEGIKPCPDKTAAVLQLPSPWTIKEVQSLNGKLASLNRYLSKSAEKSLAQFQTLKKCIKKSDFRWTAEAEQAFQQLKQHLSKLPLLVAPKPHEELIMYFEKTPTVFSGTSYHGHTDLPSSRPRTSVKGQILADFLIEMPSDVSQAAPAAVTQEEPWTLFTDGSSCVDGSGVGLILTNPEGVEFTYALRFQFMASNNEAEYEALVAGLRIAAQIGVKNVQVNVDSKLVANQVLGMYVAKEDNMIKYLELVKGLVLVEVLENKSIKEKEVAAMIEEDGPTWMTQLVDYLKERVLPGDKKEARKIRLKARQYELMEGVLYRRSPLSGRAEEGQIPDSRHGLLHEVDRSKGSGNNYQRTERANRSLGEGIKARLGERNKNWVEELPHVLWAHRIMIKSSHGDTPFSLTYGTEAVIPTEIGMPTYRPAAVDVVNNDEELRLNLDLLEECRERAAVYEARAKLKMMKYYNARVCGVAFKPGDFVYRNNDASHAIAGGKLGPK